MQPNLQDIVGFSGFGFRGTSYAPLYKELWEKFKANPDALRTSAISQLSASPSASCSNAEAVYALAALRLTGGVNDETFERFLCGVEKRDGHVCFAPGGCMIGNKEMSFVRDLFTKQYTTAECFHDPMKSQGEQ